MEKWERDFVRAQYEHFRKPLARARKATVALLKTATGSWRVDWPKIPAPEKKDDHDGWRKAIRSWASWSDKLTALLREWHEASNALGSGHSLFILARGLDKPNYERAEGLASLAEPKGDTGENTPFEDFFCYVESAGHDLWRAACGAGNVAREWFASQGVELIPSATIYFIGQTGGRHTIVTVRDGVQETARVLLPNACADILRAWEQGDDAVVNSRTTVNTLKRKLKPLAKELGRVVETTKSANKKRGGIYACPPGLAARIRPAM